jgi:hypothetical protein
VLFAGGFAASRTISNNPKHTTERVSDEEDFNIIFQVNFFSLEDTLVGLSWWQAVETLDTADS